MQSKFYHIAYFLFFFGLGIISAQTTASTTLTDEVLLDSISKPVEKKPLLLVFFSELDEISTSLHPVLKDVAAALGDKGKVIKINTEKNIKLSEALRVKVIPTLMIYKYGEMVWRQSGDQDANTLISLMKDQLN